MKSLSQYIFELNDSTYLKLAKARKAQGKDISNIISHARNIAVKKLLDEMRSYDWFEHIINLEVGERAVDIIFDEAMHDKGPTEFKDMRERMKKDLENLGKNHSEIVHGIGYSLIYSNEPPSATIYLLEKSNYIKDIKPDTILYHVTTDKAAVDNIIKNGIKGAAENRFDHYTYKCVFAFKTKSKISQYARKYLGAKSYYIIEFKAGNHIYFNDWMLNKDFIRDAGWGADKEKLSVSIFTPDDIESSLISAIYEVKGKDKKEIYKA